MKIVLALVLVACVAIQASPVNKTSVGEGEDGITPSATITGWRSGKTRWTQVVYTSYAKLKCDKKKVCHPTEQNKKVVLLKCDNLGKHCKVARTTWVTCDIKGLHCKVTKNVYTSIGKMWLKKVCSDCKKKGTKGYSKGYCKAAEAECSKVGDDDADGAHIDIKKLCAKCNKEGRCDIVKCKDGDDEDDDGHPKIKIGKLCVHCKGKRCDIVKCKDGDDEDDGEDDGHPKIKIGKLCVHCKGKKCDIVKCKDGDDEDDGAHPKSLSLCMKCEKKGGQTHCKEAKCKDGDDEDDGAHPKIKIGKLCVKCKGKRCDIVKCKDGDEEDDGGSWN